VNTSILRGQNIQYFAGQNTLDTFEHCVKHLIKLMKTYLQLIATTVLALVLLVSNHPLWSQSFNIEVDGINRTYRMHIPTGLPPQSPLVFVFHGYSGNAASIENYSEMNRIADENQFVVCYPQGLKDQWNNPFWNVRYSFHDTQNVDDVKFITTLASSLQSTYNLNPSQTFSTGMSNGGDMSYLLACEAPEIFAAIAPVAGTMMEETFLLCQGSNPMPVFKIHGTNDDITYWEGDIDDDQGYGPYLGVMTSFQFWADQNNCKDYETQELPNTNSSDGSTVTSLKYSNGINGNQVWLYQINNGGHDWPGSSGNMDINASEEIWDFFQLQISERVITSTDDEDKSYMIEAYPNPFSSSIRINYHVIDKAFVSVTIHDTTGKEIITLVNQAELPGDKSVIWNVKNVNGFIMKSGVYFVRVESGSKMYSQRIIYTLD
jgi:polyhydroxybutyrate depolymerase